MIPCALALEESTVSRHSSRRLSNSAAKTRVPEPSGAPVKLPAKRTSKRHLPASVFRRSPANCSVRVAVVPAASVVPDASVDATADMAATGARRCCAPPCAARDCAASIATATTAPMCILLREVVMLCDFARGMPPDNPSFCVWSACGGHATRMVSCKVRGIGLRMGCDRGNLRAVRIKTAAQPLGL